MQNENTPFILILGFLFIFILFAYFIVKSIIAILEDEEDEKSLKEILKNIIFKNNIKLFLKKHLIEILILFGAWIILSPVNYNDCFGLYNIEDIFCDKGFFVDWEKIGIFIIAIAGVLVLNRILNKKKI